MSTEDTKGGTEESVEYKLGIADAQERLKYMTDEIECLFDEMAASTTLSEPMKAGYMIGNLQARLILERGYRK